MSLLRLPPWRVTTAIVAIATPAVCAVVWRRLILHNISTISNGQHVGSSDDTTAPQKPASAEAVSMPRTLPPDVVEGSDWVLSHERLVSHTVALPRSNNPFQMILNALLNRYARATMEAFSRTPQAIAIRSAIGHDDAARESFRPEWINGLDFGHGDRVNGVYVIAYHGAGPADGARIELMLSPPLGYRGPVVHGLIVVGIESADAPADRPQSTDTNGHAVVFVNETWLWRRLSEPPTMLEGRLGRWLHSFLAGWLITKGVSAVLRGFSA